MGQWFPKRGRGFIFGLWSANVNGGNILGTFICTILLEYAFTWMSVWVILAVILASVCVLNLLVLKAKPEEVGLRLDDEYDISRQPIAATPPA